MELDWDLADAFLHKQIKNKPRFAQGLAEIDNLLQSHSLNNIFDNVDDKRLQIEFNNWLSGILKQQPIPQHIKSTYFGLFSMVDLNISDKEITTIHFCGSPFTPIEGDDWACEVETSFFPENRYAILTDFILLDEKINLISAKAQAEVLVFNGLLNLLLLNLPETTGKLFLSKHPTLFIGAGYDGGGTYVLEELARDGLQFGL